MWVFLALLCLPPRSSAVPFHMFQALALTSNNSRHRLRTSSPSLAPPTALPPHSEAPALSLNLGLNFKIKLRSQGKDRAGEGPGEASVRPQLPPTRPGAPTPSQAVGNRFWTEALGGSGWLGTGPADDLPSSRGRWGWDHPPTYADPTPRHPGTLWPRLTGRGLAVPTSKNSKELEFQIDIDLTAGLGSNSSSGSTGSRHYPLLPSLRVGISEIASKLGAPGLFGSMLPTEKQEPPLEWNVTSHSRQHTGGSHPTPAWALQPGPEPSSVAASPGSEGALAAPPGCLSHHRLENCGSLLPEEASGPPASPVPPLCLPPPADWDAALAEWGPAWQAQLYSAGALSTLQTLLALLRFPCRCAPGARLLALLHLLLATAGSMRAALLFTDAWGRPAPLPPWAAQLMRELPLSCLTGALAIALALLLLPQVRVAPSPAHRRCLPALLLLPLPLLHFSLVAGAAVATSLPQLSTLFLASRGTFALLTAMLSAALLAASRAAAHPPGRKAAAPAGPIADGRRWSWAILPAAACGLVSAGLHAYALLHTLRLGLPDRLLGPWAWWAMQLAGRLGEAGMGLPLAWLGLRPPPPAAEGPLLPEPLSWEPEKSSTGPGQTDHPPFCARSPGEAAPDPTAGFRPPSPVDLRRSIDEALGGGGGGGLFAGDSGSGLSAASTLSLGRATQPWLEGEPSPRAQLPPCCRPSPAASQESLALAGGQEAEAALLRREFLAVCRQIDALSLSSDTIEL